MLGALKKRKAIVRQKNKMLREMRWEEDGFHFSVLALALVRIDAPSLGRNLLPWPGQSGQD